MSTQSYLKTIMESCNRNSIAMEDTGELVNVVWDNDNACLVALMMRERLFIFHF